MKSNTWQGWALVDKTNGSVWTMHLPDGSASGPMIFHTRRDAEQVRKKMFFVHQLSYSASRVAVVVRGADAKA